jgi:cell division septum initiation protein DivIVA
MASDQHDAGATAERVAAIVAAAEASAAEMLEHAERRMEERIAEGSRAAQNRVDAAEAEAQEILREAREQAAGVVANASAEAAQARTAAESEALAIMARAEEEAARVRGDAEAQASARLESSQQQARDLVSEARAVAEEARVEGLDLTDNMRELSGSLRSNAERLVRDIQRAHARLTAALDQIDGGATALPSTRPDRGRDDPPDVFDVPEFIPGA